MPPLNEGDLLFMPILLPGASLTQVMEIMQKQNIIIKSEFPDRQKTVEVYPGTIPPSVERGLLPPLRMAPVQLAVVRICML